MRRGTVVHTADFGSARPDYHQLIIFLKVVESRSFSGAARALKRTQPAISQAIMRLEEICGGDLFYRRRGAPLTLTPMGEAIVGSARSIVDTIDRQMADAASTAIGRRGRLTLGFSGMLSAKPLHAGVATFLHDCLDVELQLIEGEADELYRNLLDNQVDLVIAPRLPNVLSENLLSETLWQEGMSIAFPVAHDLAQKTAIKWKDLLGIPVLVVGCQSVFTELWDYLARTTASKIDVRYHRVSRAAMLDAVAMGLGTTIVSQSEVTSRDDVSFRPIEDAGATISLVPRGWRMIANLSGTASLTAFAAIRREQRVSRVERSMASDRDRG